MNGGPALNKIKSDWNTLLEKNPKLASSAEFYEMTPHEMQTELFERIKYID